MGKDDFNKVFIVAKHGNSLYILKMKQLTRLKLDLALRRNEADNCKLHEGNAFHFDVNS